MSVSVGFTDARAAVYAAVEELDGLRTVVVLLIADACARRYDVQRDHLFGCRFDRRGELSERINTARACAINVLVTGRGWLVKDAAAAFDIKRERASKAVARIVDLRDEDPALDEFLADLELILSQARP